MSVVTVILPSQTTRRVAQLYYYCAHSKLYHPDLHKAWLTPSPSTPPPRQDPIACFRIPVHSQTAHSDSAALRHHVEPTPYTAGGAERHPDAEAQGQAPCGDQPGAGHWRSGLRGKPPLHVPGQPRRSCAQSPAAAHSTWACGISLQDIPAGGLPGCQTVQLCSASLPRGVQPPMWPASCAPPGSRRSVAELLMGRGQSSAAGKLHGLGRHLGAAMHTLAVQCSQDTAQGISAHIIGSRRPVQASPRCKIWRHDSSICAMHVWRLACCGLMGLSCAQVICLDNFFTGSKDNIKHLIGKPNFELMRCAFHRKIPCTYPPNLQ